MRISDYRNTYAREGAPAPVPSSAVPAQQPQMPTYVPTQPAVLDTRPSPPAQNGDAWYGTGDTQNTRNGENGENGYGNVTPRPNAMQPLRPQEPGAGRPRGGSVDDVNGNHVRDRWDDSGTHIRDMWNDRNGTRAHEIWDMEGSHVRDAWNEQTGQHVRDAWAADGSHVRDAWDEQGNHLQETWTAQGRYLRNAWSEMTARVQDVLRPKNDVQAPPADRPRGPGVPAPAPPIDDSPQPVPDTGEIGAQAPGAVSPRARPMLEDQADRPVSDGRYGRGAESPADGNGDYGQADGERVGPGGDGGGGGGGGGSAGPTGGESADPTGGAGNTGQIPTTGPHGQAATPNIDRGTDASRFSQAALNRLSRTPAQLMQLLDLALERLDKYGADDPEVQQWFGKNANVDEIRRTLEKMRQTLASGDYKFSLAPRTDDGWEMAHVFPDDGSHTIHVRPHMLDPVFGKNTPEVTLAHELSHFNDIGSTRDLKYGDWNASTLARTNSAQAVHNAENWGMFIRQVGYLTDRPDIRSLPRSGTA